ncbi:hypothetical protein VOLCADRAFT_103721 [Volvox carteri f. nagariensis]|uniref:Uncharacterized protein n=1 Tax=Volvox carteri f. nagariensis TaxID=3068 RepID=D8TN55_VOLCA|nr:uncharacterized protein VOLCADRAFT_103721 [Volvox carteri f. nagariensis]EFJ51081.1 hypothetical protein VOLCADRAFT_103721 [Volvox carteri f. nagariensis]|eukprot:XP_002948093.1 hypothetical protein VOLCADRAFT_103721 [Volvox carteri f. nagariensis]
MNYWYAPISDSQPKAVSKLPPELIAAVAAPWRSTNELEAIRAKAKTLAHYDMAGAAQDILLSRKQQESVGAVKALRRGQSHVQVQTDSAALDALTAVDNMWNVHLDQLRREAFAAVRELQEKHEEALNKMRLEQVAKARDAGIRPERRNKELLNLRRSESVLASNNNFHEAAKVKAHADELANSEACSAHMSWLLKCHSAQERLLAKQHRELEVLQGRLDVRLRDVEAARNVDLQKLQRKIKATSSQQQRSFARERHFLASALHGDMLNTITTRPGRTLAHALPTLAEMAAPKQQPEAEQAGNKQPGAPSSAGSRSGSVTNTTPGTGYLGPSSASPRGGAASRTRIEGPTASLGVRFAPTPPREAWAPEGTGAESSNAPGSRQDIGSEPNGGPPSAAVGSGTTAAATGSGSSALTEQAVRAMNQAQGVRLTDGQRGASSLQSSSFKSNKPYAAGVSMRAIARPL